MAQMNLSTKYSSIAMTAFTGRSYTGGIPFNDYYDWDGTRTVRIYMPGTAPVAPYGVDPVNRYGIPTELPNTMQTLTLTQDKAFTFLVPKRFDDNTMFMDDVGSATMRQIMEKQIPDIDTYRLATISANAGGTEVDTPTAENAYALFLRGQEFLSDNETPDEGRVAFVSNRYLKYLKLSAEFIAFQTDVKIHGLVGTIDGVPIINVPKPRLPANQHLILLHTQAVTAPVKFEEMRIDDNSMSFREAVVVGSYLHDTFVFDARKNSVYSLTAPTTP